MTRHNCRRASRNAQSEREKHSEQETLETDTEERETSLLQVAGWNTRRKAEKRIKLHTQ